MFESCWDRQKEKKMTDIVSPKGMLTKQTWKVVEHIDEMLKQHYKPDLPRPIWAVIDATERREAVEEAARMFIDKGWFAIAVSVDSKMIVRISDKEFDYEGWLCQVSGVWKGGDEERFMVTVRPSILDPGFEKIISVCGECRDKVEGIKADSGMPSMTVPNPGMEA